MSHSRVAVFLAPLVLGGVAGCSADLPAPVDPAEAGVHLRSAFESWKGKEPYESLASRQPPIVFNEPLWKDGVQLLEYQLGPVELHGRQGRCTVKLTLKHKDGKQQERNIGYQIDTAPHVVIVREGLGP